MPAASPRRVLVLGLIAVVVVAVVVAAVWSGESPEDEQGSTAPSGERTLSGLCASVDAANDGQLARAHGIFLGRAHTGLHDIAARLADGNQRRAAARLLEAKNAVEVFLPQRSETAPADLRRLLQATTHGLAALRGETSVSCPKEPTE